MSKAHKSSRLIVKNAPTMCDQYTIDLIKLNNSVLTSKGIAPIEGVYSFSKGIFGYGAAMERSTTNLVSQQDNVYPYSTGVYSVSKLSDGWKEIKVTHVGNYGIPCCLQSISIANGATASFSIEFISPSKNFIPYVTGSVGIGNMTHIGNNKYVLSWTNSTGSSKNEGVYFKYLLGSDIDVNETIYYRNYQVESVLFPTSFTQSTRGTGVLTYPIILTGDFTIAFWVSSMKYGYSIDKTYIGLSNSNSTSYINIFTGWGADLYIGDQTNRTHYRLLDFSYSNNDTAFFVIRRKSSTIYVSIFKDGKLKYSDNRTDTLFNFKIEQVRIGQGFGNQYGDTRCANAIFSDIRIDRIYRDDDTILAWYLSNSPFVWNDILTL